MYRNKTATFNLLTLLIANIAAIATFVLQDGSILQVLWIYWLQSVIVGIVNVLRILTVPLVPAVLSSQSSAFKTVPLPLIRLGTACFFVVHYGLFHVVYAVFLAAFGATSAAGLDAILAGRVAASVVLFNGLLFAIHHVISYIVERRQIVRDPNLAPRLDEVMQRPYGRILPMHLIIILGPVIAGLAGSAGVFAVFMLLKMVADIRLFAKGASHPGVITTFKPTS